VGQIDRSQERLIQLYRKKARRYELTSRLTPVPGYPELRQRRRAVQALGLGCGDTVVDVACGTGRNFALLEAVVGPSGRIIGVDLTDAMLDEAHKRIAINGWGNVSLVEADAASFDFPSRHPDAILSTYALTQVCHCADVIAHGAAALVAGGRMVVLDLQLPAAAPALLIHVGAAILRPFASIDEWLARRPWETIQTTMQAELSDTSWTDLCLGTAFLAAGSRRSRR
jgi:demethylmenaquinone methyltransferase/2-methoxy-6-polyprenyl-1,4-benzoquinol methylase